MNGSFSLRTAIRPVFVICLLVLPCLAIPTPVRAAPAAVVSITVSVPFADDDGWGVRKFLGGMNTRTRIIQVAVACMCLGLFILMRKLL